MDHERGRENADKQILKDKLFAVGAGIICALLLVTVGYVLMFYSDSYFIVAVLAVMLVVSLFVMINSMLSISRRTKEQDKEDYDEIARAQKAQYLIIKKNFDELQQRMARLEKEGSGGSIPAEEIIEAQKAVAKITISRSKENADALLNSNDALFEKVIEFEDKLKSNNKDIMDELNTQNRNLENKLNEINNAFSGMQRTLTAIEQNQRMIGNQPPVMMVAQAMPASGMQPVMQQPYVAPMAEPVTTTPVAEPAPAPEPVMPEPMAAEPMPEAAPMPEPEPVPEAAPIPEPEVAPMPEPMAEAEISVEAEMPIEPEVAAEPEMAADDLGMPDELDLVDAPLEEAMPELVEEPVMPEAEIPEMPELPEAGATDGAASDFPMPDLEELMNMDLTEEPLEVMPDIEAAPATEPAPAPVPTIEPVSDDPNAQLSPDQIAAMFAQAGGTPAPAPEPEPPAPPTVEPVSDDPNAQLTPEQIAAMFAQVQ